MARSPQREGTFAAKQPTHPMIQLEAGGPTISYYSPHARAKGQHCLEITHPKWENISGCVGEEIKHTA